MVDAKTVRRVLNLYGKAWVTQDPELILTIFTENAVYNERILKKPMIGHAQIKKYWHDKVVAGQKDIKFKLLHTWVDGNTAIAEWQADFYRTDQRVKLSMREVAILTFRGDKISSLREYWHSEELPRKKD